MKKIMPLVILLLTQTGRGNTLLIPGTQTGFEAYSAVCSGSGYICTTDHFLNILRRHRTPLFDNLIDSTDITSDKFREVFRNRIIAVLNSEELDRTQLALLLNLTQQINGIEPTFLLKSVEHELLRIQELLNQAARRPAPPKKEFIYIFKELLVAEDIERIRTTFLKIPLYVIHFSSIPYKSNSFDFRRIVKKPLLAGACGASLLQYNISAAKYCLKYPRARNENFQFTKEKFR